MYIRPVILFVMIKRYFWLGCLPLLILTASCGNSQEIQPPAEVNTSSDERQPFTEGVVLQNDGCGWLIEVPNEFGNTRFYPVNLPSEFQKNELKIRFVFQPSRARQPESCVVDRVVSVEEVSALEKRK